ncbi:MAG: tetratricopeptide repeat protein [Nitrospiraceae bacterium]|nr:tetratricopeptide repeat protein [Nitrospiraceae bacterium]
MVDKRRWFLLGIFFTCIGLAIYSRVIVDGPFLFDDYEYVVNNPIVADLAATNMSDPRQIGYLSFALNYLIGGENPMGYHLFNVLVHIANSLLVLLLLDGIVRSLNKGQEPTPIFRQAALFSALLFLVHPAQTQAVSYVTQRFTSLATLFYLLSVCLYLAARLRFERGKRSSAGYGLYAASLLCTVFAMKTKEISFTIPFIILMLETLVMSASRYQKRRFLFVLPFAVTLIIIPLSIFGPEIGLVSRSSGVADITRMEKIYDLTERSPIYYLFTQFRAIVVYIRTLLFPVNLRVVYDFPISRSFFEWRVIGSFLILLCIAAAGIYLWRKGHSLRDAENPRNQELSISCRLVALGVFWFFITLSIESSVIPIKDVIFEHRIYLPSVGFFMAVSVIVMHISHLIFRRANMLKIIVPALIIVVPLSIGTYVRNDVWTDEIKLWDDVVKKSPDKPIGYNNRGNAYAKVGDYQRALEDMSRAISFFPKNVQELNKWENADMTPSNMSKTYSGRGDVYIALGDNVKAREDFKKAKDIFVRPPMDVDGVLRMADIYAKKGAFKHAFEEYDMILEWDPENIRALNDRANAYSRTKRFPEAIRDLTRVIAIEPGYVLAYHNRGIAYAWSGNRTKAEEDFKKACDMGFQNACKSLEVVKKGDG